MYLVDTCIWIDFLKGKSTPHVELLCMLLEEGHAFINGVIQAEIYFGAKDAKQLARYQESFSAMPFLSLPEDWPTRLGSMGFQLRKAGHHPFVADLLIALTAVHHETCLLTDDRDFIPYGALFGLKLK